MSGRKESDYQLNQSARRREQLVTQISAARRGVGGIQQQLSNLIGNASPGCLRHFQEEVKQAQSWLKEVATVIDQTENCSISSTESDLSTQAALSSRSFSAGLDRQQALVRVLDQKASQLRQASRQHFQLLRKKLDQRTAFCEQWLEPGIFAQTQNQLHQVQGHIAADEFTLAQQELESIQNQIESTIENAELKEAQVLHQQSEQDYLRASHQLTAGVTQLNNTLECFTPGLRESFPGKAEALEAWVKQGPTPLTAEELQSESTESIESATREQQNFLTEAESKDRQMQEFLDTQVRELHGQVSQQHADAELRFQGHQQLLEDWHEQHRVEELRTELDKIKQLILDDYFLQASELQKELQSQLDSLLKTANEQDAKDHKRMYLLKALQNSCESLGFEELDAWHYEGNGRKENPIVLRMHPGDFEPVTFRLSLDTVVADSCLQKEYCLGDFKAISRALDEQFGIQTGFTVIEEENPKKIRKGELDEPTGHTSTAGK